VVTAVGAATEAAISRWPFRRRGRGAGDGAEREARVDALIVGLGNPGREYAGTRHNLGFEVADELSRRWELPRARKRYGGLITDGRTGPGGPRVAVLLPQTYMNESGSAAGPARGELGVPLDHVIALHDEIDLPFGEVRSKLGGGVAGHNGLRSLSQGLGGKDFWRVRAGVGRPDSTDPEIVSNYVLSRFREPDEEVRLLLQSVADEVERLLGEITGPEDEEGD
jgi:peptidyl-tRNA hydrolase, PTH1 family